MSGYFAALAAQVSAGGAGAGPVATVPSIEQHVAVDAAAVAAPTADVTVAGAAPHASLSAQQVASAPDNAPRQAQRAVIEPAPVIEQRSLAPQPIERISMPALERTAVAAQNVRIGSPADAIVRSVPTPSPTPIVRESEFSPVAMRAAAPRSPEAAPSAFSEPAVARTEPTHGPGARYVLNSRRDQRDDNVGDTPVAANQRTDATHRPSIEPPVRAIPRTDVRIGTISLEVRVPTPPPTAPTAPAPRAPTPVAAPVSAPTTRFSLQRHYLRWS